MAGDHTTLWTAAYLSARSGYSNKEASLRTTTPRLLRVYRSITPEQSLRLSRTKQEVVQYKKSMSLIVHSLSNSTCTGDSNQATTLDDLDAVGKL